MIWRRAADENEKEQIFTGFKSAVSKGTQFWKQPT